MAKLAMLLLITCLFASASAQETSMPDTTTSAIDCFISLGSNEFPVDGSFETLRGVASTSASPGLNSDVTSGGWFNGVQSADSFLAPYVSGQMNVPESPDGGVFVGASAGTSATTFWEESFYTTVEGLAVGLEYTIKFYQACTADAYGRSQDGNQGAWEITFGDQTIVSPTCTYQQGPTAWSEVSLTFTPTAASQRLEFLAKDIFNADPKWMNYMLVDGISVTPNTPRCATTTTDMEQSTIQPAIPSKLPTVTEIPAEISPKCVDISECYTLSWIDTHFTFLEPVDQSMCVYRILSGSKAGGLSGLRRANPTHLQFFVDSNGDNQLEMGFLDETTGLWTEDSGNRVTTNENGVEFKMDLEWSNGASYIASDVCPSDSPTKTPSVSMPSEAPSASMPSQSPSVSMPSEAPSASMPSQSPSGSTPSIDPTVIPSTLPTAEQVLKNCEWQAYSTPGMLDCPEPQDYISTDIQNCKSRALEIGANAIQFLDNTCRFKLCDSPGDTSSIVGSGVELRWQSYYCAAPEPATTNSSDDDCLNWVERFEYLDHACASESSVFERSELPSRKMWTYSNKFGWYTFTWNFNDLECRALCEETTRCVAFSYQPTVDQAESGCFLYSEENCAAIVADGGYRIRDKVIDCSITSSTTTTVETTPQTTIDPQEAACPNGNTLDFLGNGRCADNGAIVDWPAAGYFLHTTKEDCLAQCEANVDCTGAITAYNYYCAHYLSSDITMFDGEPSKYQTQWECHAKCHNVKREGTCNEFLVDYRLPGNSIYYTTRVSGNPIDGWYLPALCAKECEKDVQCKAFSFDTSGNTCHLGNSAELQACDFNTFNCGGNPGRMTSGSCDNTGSDGEESVCPRGFTPHGENGELNLHNHATGAWPQVDTIEECAAYCETVSCISFEYDTKSNLCATHTEADLDSRANPAGWVACLLDMDAPTLAPTPGSAEGEECPIGFHQVGDLSTNNDIGGYGMSTKAEVYSYATFDNCIERCESMPGCMAFNWNQAGMCVHYDSSVPNRDDGRGFLFCARNEETTAIPDCELSLGTDASPVDGSFESLLYAARTSENPGLNGNVNGAGWKNGMKTADSYLAPYVVGAINVPESPDGGVFAAGGALLDNEGNDLWKESFYTTVENLEIGEEYTVKFYQATTADPYGRSVDGNYAAWEVHFGGDMQMAPTLIYDSSIVEAIWSRASLTFVASSESERLEFVSKTLGGPSETDRWMNYILIDGITVSPNILECADPTMSPTISQPTARPSATPTTAMPTAAPTTPQPTHLPTEQPTPEPTKQPTEPCEVSLGSVASPVDGSFESLHDAAATSESPRLNGNVNGAGWRNGLRTADSYLAPYVVGAINVPESPDGGVFAAGGALLDNEGNDLWKESFYTTVENLQVGAEYTVKFYQATTADPYGRSVDGNYAAWEVHFGDDMQMAPTLTYDSSIVEAVWSRVSLTFVASSESERLEFVSKTLGGPTDTARWMNYILIDGISLSPNTLECADPPTTSQPTMVPTALPTTSTTPQPTNQPTEPVQIPYSGPEYFCDTYQDPHIDTWHVAGSSWRDYRIDLASTDAQLHRGDWLIFEYGAYQVIMSHAQQRWWNTHMYIKKNGAVIYSYSGRTAERVIDHSEVEVVTNPASTWVGNNYRGYGTSRYEYELVKLRNIPLEATWLQEKAYRDANSVQGRLVHGAILDVALKWNEDWRVTSGVCAATRANYAQFKLGDDIFGTGNGRRELVDEPELQTCPTLNRCCGRLAGLVNQFESCQLDNYNSCCATGADPDSCCGGWVQEAPRCSEDSCETGEACNFIDGYCYPEAEIAAVTAYKGTCHSQFDVNLDLNLCSMDSGSLKCNQVMDTDKCEDGVAYLSKTIGGKQETTFYDSCEFEWYAEYSCKPPVIACPGNYLQVGDFGSHPEGTNELEMRLNIETIGECKILCEENDNCVAFTFARPGEEIIDEFVCTLYNSVVPTSMEGTRIFCKSIDAPIVGTVTFETDFDFITNKCGDLLEPLRQVVARVSRVELRHVRTSVKDCESGSFTVDIDVESASDLDPLRETVEEDVFVQRLNHELGNHGKRSTSALNNVSTSSDSESYKTAFFITVIISSVLVVAIVGLICKQNCSSQKEDEFDPELAQKRQPEFKPEISLKTMGVPEIDSNQDSGTFYENVWENTTTTPRGEKLPTQ